MPIGLNDLTSLANTAWKLYHIASTEYYCANQEYQDFVNDVDTLRRSLRALEDAATRSEGDGPRLQLSTDFVTLVTTETGQTLRSCRHLIDRNPYFKKTGGAVTNLVWALTVKEDVAKLQTRLQICFQKVNFILQRQDENNNQAALEIFAANNQSNADAILDLLRQVANQVGIPLAEVPGTLLSNEVRNRILDVQKQRSAPEDFRIVQRIDSLLIFYERSTHNFVSQPPVLTSPPPSQYLSLLKCLYLLEDIKNDPQYRTYIQKPMSNAWLIFNGNKVTKEAMRFLNTDTQLDRVPDEDLLRLNDEEFVLDLKYLHERSVIDPQIANPGEVLLARWTLTSTSHWSVEQLSVFRVGEDKLRLTKIISTSRDGHMASTSVHEQELDTRTVVLEPIYTMSATAQPSMVWRPTSATTLAHDLHFTSKEHVKEFQRVVTNHVIVLDEDTLVSGHKGSSWSPWANTSFAEEGRIQLWSYKDPINPGIYAKPGQGLSDGSTVQSPLSSQSPSMTQSEYTITQKALEGLTETKVLQSNVHGNDLIRPMPYQVVIMAKIDGKRRLISIQIDKDTSVNRDKCHCSRKNSTCTEVYIEHAKKKLHITTVGSRGSSGDGPGNLAVFGKVDHHKQHQDLPGAQVERVKYVVLKFTDVEACQKFSGKLDKACRIMVNNHNDYMIAEHRIRSLATIPT